MGQAGRDGWDGLVVLRRAWDRLVGMVGMVLLCPIMCGTGWFGRSDGRDGADTAARAEIFPN